MGKSAKTYLRRTGLDIAVEILAIVVLAFFLTAVQSSFSVNRQKDNSRTKLDIAQQRIAANAESANENLETYDLFSTAKLDTIAYFIDNNPSYGEDLAAVTTQWGLKSLSILSPDGALRTRVGATPAVPADELLKQMQETNAAVTVEETGVRYYLSKLANGDLIVAGRDSAEMLASQAELRANARALKTIKVGTGGYVCAINIADNTVDYHPDPSYIGQTLESLGIKGGKLQDGYEGWMKVGAAQYYGECRLINDTCMLVALVPEAELNALNVKMVWLALAVFIIVVSVVVAYALILRKDMAGRPKSDYEIVAFGKKKKYYLNKTIAAKIQNISVIGLIVIFGATFYVQSLAALSRQSTISDTKLEAVREILAENDATTAEMTDEYSAEYTRKAQNVAFVLGKDPTLIDDDKLVDLAARAQVQAIYVFNNRGRTVATNTVYKDFALSDDPEDQSYPFWEIIKGYKDAIAQPAQMDDSAEHRYIQYIGVERLDEPGLVQIGVSPKRLEKKLRTTQLSYVLGNIAVENEGYLFAVNKEDLTFATYPTEKYVGRPASEYGMTEAAFRDDYCGYQTIDTVPCFVTCMEYGDVYLYVAVPVEAVCNNRLAMSIIVTLASLIVLLLVGALLVISDKPMEDGPMASGKSSHIDQMQSSNFFSTILPSGRRRQIQTAVSRWDHEADIPWNKKTPEQKLQQILLWILGVVALALIVYISVMGTTYDRRSILSYIVSLQWEKTPNIFSFSYIGLIIIEITVITWIARKFIVVVTRSLGARSETVGRLLDNFIKYVSVIAAVFYSMSFLGIDPSLLMTSAGLLTLIVGLGAQRLVGDILSGIFIVFEGEFRVGDIVTIGDWRGTVLEIGIRTTKIEDTGKNIKIFNNSGISGVINMTKQYSFASCDVTVNYTDSVESLEKLLDKELPSVRGHLPAIVGGPYYQGLVAASASTVNVHIVAQCSEADRPQLQRDMIREMKLMFDRNNIKVSV